MSDASPALPPDAPPPTPLPPPRAVFFDACGTLVFAHPGVAEVYEDVAHDFGVGGFDTERLNAAFRRHLVRMQGAARADGRLAYGTTETDARTFWRELARASFLDLGGSGAEWAHRPEFNSYARILFDEFSTARRYRLEPTARETFDALRTRGIQVGVLSNWDVRLHAILSDFELAPLVDVYAASHLLGVEKPDRTAFERAAAMAHCAPSEAWMVGDRVDEDYAGAENAGLTGFLLAPRTADEGWGYRTLTTLSDLLSWIEA